MSTYRPVANSKYVNSFFLNHVGKKNML